MGGDNTKTIPVSGAELPDHAVQIIKPTGLALVGENGPISKHLAFIIPLINEMLVRYGYNNGNPLLSFINPDRGRKRRYRLSGTRRHLQHSLAVMVKPCFDSLVLVVSQFNSSWH